MIRILHLIPALEEGGAERVVVNTAIMEQAHGFQPLVVSSGGRMVNELLSAGIEHLSWPVASKNPLVILRNAARLAALTRARDIRIVHAHSRAPAWSGFLACRWTGACFITTFHGLYGHRNLLKRWYNSVMTRGEFTFVPSSFIGDHARKVYGAAAERVTVVPPRINDFAPVSQHELDLFRHKYQLAERQPVFCVVGRLSRLKGHEVVLRAFARLGEADARLLIVGSEQRKGYLAELSALARQLGVESQVIFTGGGRDLPRLAYAVSRALISASTHPESFGLTVLEAASCGLPALAAAHGGVLDLIIDSQNGFLVTPSDVEALTDAMGRLLRLSDGEYSALCMGARRQAEKFNSATSSALLLNVYRRLLSVGNRP